MQKILSQKHYYQVTMILTLLADVVVVALGFILPYYAYSIPASISSPPAGLLSGLLAILTREYLGSLVFLVVVLHLTIFWLIGLYKREITYLNFEEIRKAIKAVLISYFIMALALVVGADIKPYQQMIITGLAATLFGIVTERYIFYEIAKANYRKGIWVKKVAIYDACPTGRLLLKKLFEAPQLGYKPVGFIDNKRKKGSIVKTNSLETKAQVPVLGKLASLLRIIKEHEIAELFIATTAIKVGDMKKIVMTCKKARLPYRFIPNLIEEPFHRAVMYSVGGIPFIRTEEPRVDVFTRVAKRSIDVVFSLLVLILFSPLYLIIAALVKRDSKGPVVFKQKRIGVYGIPFTMYKFRTMYTLSYEYSPKDHNDKRITRIGKFLRRTSLDELPQFLNVLKGEMSIVGPRPEMEFIVKGYNAVQRERLLVKPGITGIWQVTADRKKLIHENLDYDLYYIDNVSILLDLVIMVRTVWFVVRGVGAV